MRRVCGDMIQVFRFLSGSNALTSCMFQIVGQRIFTDLQRFRFSQRVVNIMSGIVCLSGLLALILFSVSFVIFWWFWFMHGDGISWAFYGVSNSSYPVNMLCDVMLSTMIMILTRVSKYVLLLTTPPDSLSEFLFMISEKHKQNLIESCFDLNVFC